MVEVVKFKIRVDVGKTSATFVRQQLNNMVEVIKFKIRVDVGNTLAIYLYN